MATREAPRGVRRGQATAVLSSPDGALVRLRAPAGEVRAVALVLHGGREQGHEAVADGALTVRRMQPFARALTVAGGRHGLAVAELRYRHRGWNGEGSGPVADAAWALETVTSMHGEVAVVMVGHSMGARTALRIAGAPAVCGVVGLAPWLPGGEPVVQSPASTIVLLHGRWDRTVRPELSLAYAMRAARIDARLCRIEIRRDSHAMLLRPRTWHRLATYAALACLGLNAFPTPIAAALAATTPAGRFEGSL